MLSIWTTITILMNTMNKRVLYQPINYYLAE